MLKFNLILLGCIILLLFGCSKHDDASSTKSKANACKYRCNVLHDKCKSLCDDGCEQCLKQSFAANNRHYAQFIHQQIIQGGLVARELKSYRDPLQCLKTTCNCHADYYLCLDACTGSIHKRLQSPMTCR